MARIFCLAYDGFFSMAPRVRSSWDRAYPLNPHIYWNKRNPTFDGHGMEHNRYHLLRPWLQSVDHNAAFTGPNTFYRDPGIQEQWGVYVGKAKFVYCVGRATIAIHGS